MSLLPSTPDVSRDEETAPRVVDVDSEEAEAVLSALSSETARELLSAVYDDPAPPSALADRVDTTLQNAQYHLENLEEAGAIEVVDTAYSEKGREMDVYAPADEPLVIFAGDEEEESTLRTALSRLLGAVGLLAVASFAVQRLLEPGGPLGTSTDAGGESASPPAAGNESTPTPTGEDPTPTEAPPEGDGTPAFEAQDSSEVTEQAVTETPVAEETTRGTEAPANVTDTPTEAVDPETTTAAADATREVAAGLPPGLVFFAGGLFVLAVVAALLYLRDR